MLTNPFDRGGDGGLLDFAEVAPVVALAVVGDEAVGPALAGADGAGEIHAHLAGAVAAEAGAHGAGGFELRLFGYHIHHAAGVLHAVECGGRAFEHFHALGGGAEYVGLGHLHAVAQHGVVAVVAEAAFHHGLKRAGQGVGLADAAHGEQGFIQRAGAAVFQHGGGNDVYAAGHFEQRGVAAADDIGGNGLVAAGIAAAGGNFDGFELGAVGAVGLLLLPLGRLCLIRAFGIKQAGAADGGKGEDEGFEVCARLFHEAVPLKIKRQTKNRQLG